ncbi:hypothetical protein AVEN_175820-1 [Araneus ventricosus]|uniref:Uncharacterized protein n=1 Tax=Araneus ventricosus TaxID=182803 RepID=A0A4Y2F4I6_ARAVE|nr:hypothetical protein AVEN_175820-1 [Araneus ventricosus]
MNFSHRSYKDANVDYKPPFAESSSSLVASRCTSSELTNRCSLNKLFIRGKSRMERDHENKLVIKVPKCDILACNVIPGGTCDLSKDLVVRVSPNRGNV